ncbi:MAG: hemolysin family protein [Candidatus Absconditabacterales bacterium]|nr:hemolysin family protein [Candidatus Absconditabacterales bacterium]
MDPVLILIFLVLFFLSAFFSSSETAFMSIPEHKIDAFIKQKKFGAIELKKLRSNKDRLLITLLVGNNLVNVFTASLATTIALNMANALGLAQSTAIGISTGVVTLLLLLFGEIFPKTFATRYTDKISLSVSKIYVLLQIILYPIIVGIEFLMKKLQKTKTEQPMTDEEIEAFIDMGKELGVLEKGEHEKIKNMLDFYEITCEEVMTPRVKIDAISCDLSVNKAIEKLLKFSHTRILVYKGNVDYSERVVTLKELFKMQRKGFGEKKLYELDLSTLIKVPLTKPIHSLLDVFKKTRKHIAIVIDEYGGVAGLVSLEDVVEEVFGEIWDETDNDIEPIRADDNGSYLFQSEVRVEEVLERFDLDFDDIELEESAFSGETIGYFIMSYLERFPKKGDKIKFLIQKYGDKEQESSLNLEVMGVKKNIIGDVKAWISS